MKFAQTLKQYLTKYSIEVHALSKQYNLFFLSFIARSVKVINPALSLLMKHLVTGQGLNAHNFLAFHWSLHACLVSIGQHFVTTRVVHLPKRTKRSLITEKDQADLITESDNAVRTVHSWF